MEWLLTILQALVSVAASYGIQIGSDIIDKTNAENLNLTSYDITKALNDIVSQTYTMSQNKVDSLYQQLSKISGLSKYASGIVKQKLRQATKQLQDKYDTAKEKSSQLTTDIENLKSKANALAYSSDAVRASQWGQTTAKQLQQEAANVIDKYNGNTDQSSKVEEESKKKASSVHVLPPGHGITYYTVDKEI